MRDLRLELRRADSDAVQLDKFSQVRGSGKASLEARLYEWQKKRGAEGVIPSFPTARNVLLFLLPDMKRFGSGKRRCEETCRILNLVRA